MLPLNIYIMKSKSVCYFDSSFYYYFCRGTLVFKLIEHQAKDGSNGKGYRSKALHKTDFLSRLILFFKINHYECKWNILFLQTETYEKF